MMTKPAKRAKKARRRVLDTYEFSPKTRLLLQKLVEHFQENRQSPLETPNKKTVLEVIIQEAAEQRGITED